MMMTMRRRMKKSSSGDEMIAGGKVVIVAIKASREIPKAGLMWALTHVAQPGDCIKLLVVIPSHSSGKKMRVLARFASDCTTGHHHRSVSKMGLDRKDEITNLCSRMMHELQDVYDPDKVKVRLKIVFQEPCGVVALEAKKTQSNWLVLDRRLKHEKKKCVDELQCNLVIMDRSKAKVLRLNLVGSPSLCATEISRLSCAERDTTPEASTIRVPLVTPASSPDHESPVTMTDVGTSSISSSDPGNLPYLLSEVQKRLKEQFAENIYLDQKVEESDSDTDSKCFGPLSTSWTEDGFSPSGKVVRFSEDESPKALLFNYEALLYEISKLDREINDRMNVRLDLNLSRSVREAVSLLRNGPPSPPPLCSVCQHKAPVFGNPPRWFSYTELELATDGFSS